MRKTTADLMATMMLMSGCIDPMYAPTFRFRSGGTKKRYENKDANIEYYTDEKGNIRKRKKK